MPITPAEIKSLIAREIAGLRDQRVVSHILALLVEPSVVIREWDYGAAGEAYPCWAVLDHVESNTGIAYCEFGFGPRTPWGLVFLSGSSHMSIGMDSGWFESFLEAYFDSMVAAELPIWRAFRQDGGKYPGAPLTDESDWDSTWKEVYRLRESDASGRYNCSQSIYPRKDET
jgi:hypothetical protein